MVCCSWLFLFVRAAILSTNSVRSFVSLLFRVFCVACLLCRRFTVVEILDSLDSSLHHAFDIKSAKDVQHTQHPKAIRQKILCFEPPTKPNSNIKHPTNMKLLTAVVSLLSIPSTNAEGPYWVSRLSCLAALLTCYLCLSHHLSPTCSITYNLHYPPS